MTSNVRSAQGVSFRRPAHLSRNLARRIQPDRTPDQGGRRYQREPSLNKAEVAHAENNGGNLGCAKQPRDRARQRYFRDGGGAQAPRHYRREETGDGHGETESHVEIHPMDGRAPERERHTSHGFHDLKALLRGWPERLKSYGMP
jgi:hypothetical protein